MKRKILKIKEFHSTLYNLMIDTKVLKAAHWAQLLGVSPSAVSQWLKGVTIPSAQNLQMIVDFFFRTSQKEKRIQNLLKEFEEMADKLIEKDSDEFRQFKTLRVSDYYLKPLLQNMEVHLSRLSPRIKKEMISFFIRFCIQTKELRKSKYSEQQLISFLINTNLRELLSKEAAEEEEIKSLIKKEDHSFTIYLADTTDELVETRKQVYQYLKTLKVEVFPRSNRSASQFELAEYKQQIIKDLLKSDLSIHIIGELNVSKFKEGTGESISVIQNECASYLSVKTGLKRIIWNPDFISQSNYNHWASLKIGSSNADVINLPLSELLLSLRRKVLDLRNKSVIPDISYQAILDQSSNPFPGLRSFREEERPYFFGREKEINNIYDKLLTDRVVTVVGASGSGKSSLIKCGLVATIKTQPADESWKIVSLNLGIDPLDHLAKSLLAGRIQWPLKQTLESVKKTSLENTNNKLLIILDQFEELIKYPETSRDEWESMAFIQFILMALKNPSIYLIIVLRSEYIDHFNNFPELAKLVKKSYFQVLPLSKQKLRQAIAEPINRCGKKIEPALVESLIQEFQPKHPSLSMLQHNLSILWDFSATTKKEIIDIPLYSSMKKKLEKEIGKIAPIRFGGSNPIKESTVPSRKGLIVDFNMEVAPSLRNILSKNDDGSKNCDMDLLLWEGVSPSFDIKKPINDLLKEETDMVFLYFSGHGVLDETLVLKPTEHSTNNIKFDELLSIANLSKVKNIVIVVNCCTKTEFKKFKNIPARDGVSTIFHFCDYYNWSKNSFSSVIINGLQGDAANLSGRISTADLCGYAANQINNWVGKSLFNFTISKNSIIRKSKPKIAAHELGTMMNKFIKLSSCNPVTLTHSSFEKLSDLDLISDKDGVYKFTSLGNEYLKLMQEGKLKEAFI